MTQKQIPKMTYVVYVTIKNKQINKECIEGIKRQSNVKNIVYCLPHHKAFSNDDWMVLVENDVMLKDNWIEKMWEYKHLGNVIVGRAVEHPKVKEYKEKTIKIEETNEHYVQCSLSKGYAMVGISKWISVPVISYHCPSYKHNPYMQGTMELIPMKRILRTILGGIKISIKERHWIFARNSILRGAGMLMRRIL